MLVAVRLRWESMGLFCIVSRNCTFSSLQQKPHGVLCWIFWLLFRKGLIYICYKMRKEISKAHRLLFGLVNPSRPCLAKPSLCLPFLKDSSISVSAMSSNPRIRFRTHEDPWLSHDSKILQLDPSAIRICDRR